jgi:hypothetical protein
MCIINFTHLVNTIHSFSQACLCFSFLSHNLCVIFLIARFFVTNFQKKSHGSRAFFLGESAQEFYL